MIPLSHYLILGALLFSIGVVGVFLNRKNLIILLMAIELMLLAVNMNFIAFSRMMRRLEFWPGRRAMMFERPGKTSCRKVSIR